jgi:hypothetical protein
MTHALPVVLNDRLLPAVELRAAELDGDLCSLGHAFTIGDLPETAESRALSLESHVPSGAVLADRSAAWVWGWSPERTALRLCVAKTARIGSNTRRAHQVREAAIDPDEIHVVGGVPVTSPERTLIDLARFDERDDIAGLLARGIRAGGMSPEVVWAALDRRPASAGRRRARVRLIAALAVEQSRDDSFEGCQPLLTR